MQVKRLDIPEVLLATPDKHGDARGFFSEVYNRRTWAAAGIAAEFVQDNYSFSADRGTVRGLHFQTPPHAQHKLVRVLRGSVFDVALDLRRGSPTYGKHVSTVLAAAAWAQLFVPAGFAHGLMTLEPDTELLYKVSGYYAPSHDQGILWNDPALGIAWPLPAAEAKLSDKDRAHPAFANFDSPFVFADVSAELKSPKSPKQERRK